jgi:hypothetical protein
MTSTAFQLAQLLERLYKVATDVSVSSVFADEVLISAKHYWFGSEERNPDTLHVKIKPNSNLDQQDDYITLSEAIEIMEKEQTDAVRKEALSKLTDEEKEVLGLS